MSIGTYLNHAQYNINEDTYVKENPAVYLDLFLEGSEYLTPPPACHAGSAISCYVNKETMLLVQGVTGNDFMNGGS